MSLLNVYDIIQSFKWYFNTLDSEWNEEPTGFTIIFLLSSNAFPGE